MKILSEHACFGGTIGYYQHFSEANQCDMKFTVFMPAQAKNTPVPAVYFLSGLTCTEDNFTTKSGAYATAAKLGLAIIAPDTSPRGDDVPDEDGWDFGKGAGFYLNATQEPWAKNYNMHDYITVDLYNMISNSEQFNINKNRQGIFGHSMGGHGALTIYLKHPELFHTVSAFAPISNPTQCPWGQKAFSKYLGDNKKTWGQYDATRIMRGIDYTKSRPPILIDQGSADDYLKEQLLPENFVSACNDSRQDVILRMQDGYDHGYFFIQSFVQDHLEHHYKYLTQG